MALIYCKNCGNQISDKAPSCPHCGALPDMAQRQTTSVIYGSQTQKPKRHTGVIVLVVLIVLASFIAAVLIPVKLAADEHKNGTVTEYRASSVGTEYNSSYNNTYTVYLTVNLEKGKIKGGADFLGEEFVDKQGYSEVIIKVDGEDVGTMSIGDQNTFDCNLSLGEHKLEVVAKTKTRVRYSDEINVTGNNDSYKYNLKCGITKIELN